MRMFGRCVYGVRNKWMFERISSFWLYVIVILSITELKSFISCSLYTRAFLRMSYLARIRNTLYVSRFRFYLGINSEQGPAGAKGEPGDVGPPGRDGVDGKPGPQGPPVSENLFHSSNSYVKHMAIGQCFRYLWQVSNVFLVVYVHA